MSSTRKLNLSENNFENFRLNFRKNGILAHSFFVIGGQMMVDIAGESASHSLRINMLFTNFWALNF